MKIVFCSLLFVCLLDATEFVCLTTATGTNWSSAAHWSSCNGVIPNNADGSGDTYFAQLSHATTIDSSVTVGRSAAIGTKTGTIACPNTTAVTGTSTLFTTELRIGDTLTSGTSVRVITAIADDTHLTLNASPGTINAGSAYTTRPYAIWVRDLSAPAITVSGGVTLTLVGDFNVAGPSLTLAAGSILTITGAAYQISLGADASARTAVFTTNGTSGSHVTISSTSSGIIVANAGSSTNGSTNFNYTDFSGMGSATTATVNAHANGVGKGLVFDHCTFTNSGSIGNSLAAVTLNANISFTNNRLISLPSGVATEYNYVNLLGTGGTPTGTRVFTGNVFSIPENDSGVSFGSECKNFTITNNLFSRSRCATSGSGAPTDYGYNLHVFRKGAANSNQWSFLGDAGTTLHDLYYFNDEGEGQGGDHQIMSNDAVTLNGTWRMTNYIFERASQAKMQWIHPDGADGAGATGTVLFQFDKMLELPNNVGRSPGAINFRGGNFSTVSMTHNSFMTDPADTSATNTAAGATVIGSLFSGHSGMFTEIRDNLAWQAAARSGTMIFGFLFGVGTVNAASSYAADSIVASGSKNNAYYNGTNGTMYDAAGANGVSILGWNGFKQTTQPDYTHDVNLGSGTGNSGPRFLDSTRNLATFDTAYLSNTATPWVDATLYNVGDLVSASTSTFYNGVTINYRCVKAHTSDAADATNGKPGSAVTLSASAPVSGYRVNWEFATVERFRTAIIAGTTIVDNRIGCASCTYIQALENWVRQGFMPTNLALKGVASDGTDIGAVTITKWAMPGGIGIGGVAF